MSQERALTLVGNSANWVSECGDGRPLAAANWLTSASAWSRSRRASARSDTSTVKRSTRVPSAVRDQICESATPRSPTSHWIRQKFSASAPGDRSVQVPPFANADAMWACRAESEPGFVTSNRSLARAARRAVSHSAGDVAAFCRSRALRRPGAANPPTHIGRTNWGRGGPGRGPSRSGAIDIHERAPAERTPASRGNDQSDGGSGGWPPTAPKDDAAGQASRLSVVSAGRAAPRVPWLSTCSRRHPCRRPS